MPRYRIKPKRDWGHFKWWREGRFIEHGFVVTDAQGFINVMPGAAWFETVAQAMDALDILISVRGDAVRFWKAYYAIRGTAQ